MALTVPTSPTYYTTDFSNLGGADFSQDSSLVDKSRSPDLLNMISDNGSFPKKRKGWEILNQTLTGKVYNIWTFKADKRRCVVNIGTQLIEYDLTSNTFITANAVTVPEGKKGAFYFKTGVTEGLYILAGDKLLVASGEGNLTFTEPNYYVPLVIISRDPSNGGGTIYDDINLMTRERKEMFLANATTPPTTFIVTGEVDTAKSLTFEYFDEATCDWIVDTTATVDSSDNSIVKITTGHTYCGYMGKGSDNVRITYSAKGDTGKEKICKCTSIGRYDQGVSTQIFVTGNEDYRQYVYYCGLNDPTYWGDLNYMLVGNDGARVMGFANISGCLAVIKEETQEDATVFLLTSTSTSTTTVNTDGSMSTDSTDVFKLSRAQASNGALSKWAFASLNDEPLVLTRHGIYGLTTTSLTQERVFKNRSRFIDRRLTKEANLSEAIAVAYKNYYILCINSHCYVLDGRQTTSDKWGNSNFLYESYYWDNIPATAFATWGDELYFGTSDGKICRFKTKETDDDNYIYDFSDGSIGEHGATGSVDGTAIKAVWSTPHYDDGAPQYLKTAQKKGSLVTLQPYEKSGVSLYMRTDVGEMVYYGHMNLDAWKGFEKIDFGRFAFDTSSGVKDYYIPKKIKKYKRITVYLINDVVNEPFGIDEIIRTFIKVKYAKG